ncbi:hypothetical protein EZ449_13560 [Pedobacter frigidisoli]|uniref:Uncharacterized protein n=1 Tax=Pedobacter frigidisoli TaxID=2530455 RepID=A0A4R0P1T9_9SPHI|nr:hypothetical protein [Pedobacter frigidisoli]TCD07567.1 hypothetical protein EZ449_13560 [Pedobacter frigidisoli]
MKTNSIVDKLLEVNTNMDELGKQLAFERGNPYYAQFSEDGGYWRKELPTGEKFVVEVEIICDDQGMPKEIKDTIIRQIA